MLPPPHHRPPSTDKFPRTLSSADFVFVCEDASLQPLSQLYRGPIKVLARFSKYFTLQRGSRTDTVSFDHRKLVRVLTLFHSSSLGKVGLLVLLRLLFRCCLLHLLDRILHDMHVLQPPLLYLEDVLGGSSCSGSECCPSRFVCKRNLSEGIRVDQSRNQI